MMRPQIMNRQPARDRRQRPLFPLLVTAGAVVVFVFPAHARPTRTPTATATPPATASRTPTVTATSIPTNTATPTATPRVIHVDIGSATGRPGDSVDVVVSLTASGVPVAATGNDLRFAKLAFSLDPSNCRLNPALGKSLVASLLAEDAFSQTLRLFVQSDQNDSRIPDGPLYTCTLQIAPTTLPGEYSLTNETVIAFGPDAAPLAPVVGANGLIAVTLVPQPTETPTPVPIMCSRMVTLVPAAARAGATVDVSGQCQFIHSGRSAKVYFDGAVVGTVIGDTLGNYSTSITVPDDAVVGTHQLLILIGTDQIGSADFDVTAPRCPADCNGDGQITISDLLILVNISLGDDPLSSCPSGDINGDGVVAVDDLIGAVGTALNGCPG
jgi:hypothetical protein